MKVIGKGVHDDLDQPINSGFDKMSRFSRSKTSPTLAGNPVTLRNFMYYY